MLIHAEQPVNWDADLQASFTLPNNALRIEAQARIAWHDKDGNLGIRFLKIAQRQRRTLELWLAQQFLAN